MKINFLTGSLTLRKHRTGVHWYHENLLNEIHKNDYYKNNMIVSCYSSRKSMEKEFPEYASENYSDCLRFSNKIVRFFSYLLPIEIFFGRADIYFCDGLVPITLFKAKKVAVIHDQMVKLYPEYYSCIRKLYLNLYYNRCKKADCVIVNSVTTKNDVIRFLGIPEKRIKVAYIGFNSTTEKKAIDVSNISIKNKSILDLSSRYLFYIGDMRKNKNLITAIKAVEYANNNGFEINFYIAGSKSGEYDSILEYVRLHNLQDKVFFCGYVSEIEKEALYRNAYALLFVSEYEGFGIPILEAAEYDTPVITSNISAMAEIAEGACVLVDPHDYVEIASSFELLLNNEYRNSIIRAQKKLLDKYTWERVGAEIINILDEIRGETI